ncbi:related to KRE6 - beta-1,6-glucan synthetase [Melanopsichium pennsylvanicum]|uniref:Related to KRE6 - beta-1,6-glucan synthetase n=2 Tax=Melanopsichium pennsylvanicum TaxID=63383 RepID=A0AAJ4XPN9_9BASI|nr:related to KRE6-beta-1,6-glucan synthetase [Melanopsichium pennsylvanicum 4]SNX86107.1 related to KRE6 - beta-1,6-glucan synthetase [Melanopsichium pennsylvanicum]
MSQDYSPKPDSGAAAAPSAPSAPAAPRSPTACIATLLPHQREHSLERPRSELQRNWSDLSLDIHVNPRVSSLLRCYTDSIHSTSEDDRSEDGKTGMAHAYAAYDAVSDADDSKQALNPNKHTSIDSHNLANLSYSIDPDTSSASRYVNLGMVRPLSYHPNDQKVNPRAVRDPFSLPPSIMASSISMDGGATPYSEHNDLFSNPYSWDTIDGKKEPDDDLHDPDVHMDSKHGWFGGKVGDRGVLNVGVLAILAFGLVLLFGGYPIISYYERRHEGTKGGYNLGGVNASGQVASIPGMRSSLIDPDTPQDVYSRLSPDGTKSMKLVFSDEFNTDGRSFYPGDDPYWEASDLHYWATNNYEWYSPEAVTTSGGSLRITLDQIETNNLNFRGGFLSSWNKFCFTGGYLVASVQLPGAPRVAGLWPAFWTMGNLGRAGYGATTDGTWPYSYTACDVGTLMNQTDANQEPSAALIGGNVTWNRKAESTSLSFLPGQRLSACTCSGEDHPGPLLKDGSWRGRSAPEIDVFEAQVDSTLGLTVSQSMQTAPFNMYYNLTNTTGPAYDFFQSESHLNSYNGQNDQQALSGVSLASQTAVQRGGDGTYATYGFEYEPGLQGYIDWVSNGARAWRVNAAALEADPVSEISDRPIPEEPMYIIFNLGISQNFGTPDWKRLKFPAIMSVDWVRVYQDPDSENVGCDPADFPTADYIARHRPAYDNANYTIWGGTAEEGGYGAQWPKNRLYPEGCSAPNSTSPGSPVETYPQASAVPSSQIAKR